MTEMKKVYWKVLRVSNNGNKLQSCYARGRHCLIYKENRWTKPKIGKLFIFANNHAAQTFSSFSGNLLVVKRCEAKNVTKPNIKHICADDYPQFYHKVWRGFFKFLEKRFFRMYLPPGTLFADAVKILPDK